MVSSRLLPGLESEAERSHEASSVDRVAESATLPMGKSSPSPHTDDVYRAICALFFKTSTRKYFSSSVKGPTYTVSLLNLTPTVVWNAENSTQ